MSSSAFALLGRILHAPGPEEGAVDGITRTRLLAWAKAQGVPIVERLSVEELSRATEIFLTSTLAGLVPVRRIEGIQDTLAGPAGAFTQRARAAMGEPAPAPAGKT